MADRLAITRAVSPAIGRCELTHLKREPIDLEQARRQHAELEANLERLSCRIERLPSDDDRPDSVFVEDTAIVFDDLAVITRPGAASRRPETASIAEALRPHRELAFIEPPATLDGGDVLCVGSDVFVGMSSRTDPAALVQLAALLEPRGRRVRGVELDACLHLKTAACVVADGTLLVQPRWVGTHVFGDLECIEVDETEPFAANALRVGATVIHPAAFPRTRERLERRSITVISTPAEELARAEGGVTCCALLVEHVDAV